MVFQAAWPVQGLEGWIEDYVEVMDNIVRTYYYLLTVLNDLYGVGQSDGGRKTNVHTTINCTVLMHPPRMAGLYIFLTGTDSGDTNIKTHTISTLIILPRFCLDLATDSSVSP